MTREALVDDTMQQGYRYQRTAPMGAQFAASFAPQLTPAEMLALGVFCGKYMTDCRAEFPAAWFARAKLAAGPPDCSLNYFGVRAGSSLAEWRAKGWIHPDDPRGWFQWYCRYYSGRRTGAEDERQIRALARLPPPCRAGRAPLRARRPVLPPAPAPGAAAVGLRQPDAMTEKGPGIAAGAPSPFDWAVTRSARDQWYFA